MNTPRNSVGAVVIGRNEGDRLIRGLTALKQELTYIIYVDSGSTDCSVAYARENGITVIELDMRVPFTAARARNAGWTKLREISRLRYVQFLDGDCEVQPGWITEAFTFMEENGTVAVTCGRRREQFPEKSVYNKLIDMEWDTPIGKTRACGGDALMRLTALEAVGGYRDTMIAGEEPELCVRLRKTGWEICRLDTEMTLHDAAITRFGQWWTRARRAGHAYAEGAALHGSAPERHNVAAVCRALFWGLGIPLVTGIVALYSIWIGALILLVWPAQILRLYQRDKDIAQSVFLVLSKPAEALGILEYARGKLTGRGRGLIEYK